MIAYRPPVYHPGISSAPRPQMGSLSSMTVGDWLLLGGGAIVGGSGVNGLVGNFLGKKPKPNAVSILLNVILAGVGLTLFVDKGRKAISSAA